MTKSLAADFNKNPEGIPKEHLKFLIKQYGLEPGINMALFIAAGALGKKKTWTGTDYAEHWLRVSRAGDPDISDEEKITGALHDVKEDSDWEIEDFAEVGFNLHICTGVDSVSKKEGEKYLDATKRASVNPVGRRVKKRDNKDNMDLTRSQFAATDKQKYLYHISYTYLHAVENGRIVPDYPIWSFLKMPEFAGLLTKDNVDIIARSTLEKMPVDIAAKFNSQTGTTAPQPA